MSNGKHRKPGEAKKEKEDKEKNEKPEVNPQGNTGDPAKPPED